MLKVLLSLAVLATLYLLFSVSQSLQTEPNDVDISVFDSEVRATRLSIAVIGGLHLREGQDWPNSDRYYLRLRQLSPT